MATQAEKIQHRYEHKFVFEDKQTAFVQQIVLGHPANFHEIFQSRQINNIYLDEPSFTYYKDHIQGKYTRKKVRIRWYGDTFGKISHPILEFKIRNGDLRIKKSYPLGNFSMENGFSAEHIKAVLASANLPFHVNEELQALEACLLNSYQRTYYRSFDKSYRFTIDDGLSYYKLRQLSNSFSERGKDEGRVVLELKFAPKFILNAPTIHNKLPLQSTDFSKYVSGISKLYVPLL